MTLRILIAIFLLAPAAMADTFTFSNTTDVEDAMIRSNNVDANFGSRTDISIFDNGSFYYSSLIRVQNIADSIGAGATSITAICSVYNFAGSGCVVYAYRVFPPWVEGTQNGGTNTPGATHNDWDNDDSEWTDPGAGCADDAGVDNSCPNDVACIADSADVKATEIDSVDVDTEGAWFVFTIPTALAQGWYDGTINEEGIIFKVIATCGGIGFYSSESGTNPPRWVFTYTVGAPAATAAQVIIIGGQ